MIETVSTVEFRLVLSPCIDGTCSTIAATATAVPPHILTCQDVKAHISRVFNIEGYRLESMMNIIGNTEIHKRHLIFPLDYTITPRSVLKTNQEYREQAIILGKKVAEECLEKARLKPVDVDLILAVSCTGFMIPSLDTHLINLMGFRSDVERLPITELGCAAGAMALKQSWEYLRAFPERNVLVVSVELPSLTFQRKDSSSTNLICSVLFGDRAAAAVLWFADHTHWTACALAILHRKARLFSHLLGVSGSARTLWGRKLKWNRLPHASEFRNGFLRRSGM